MDQGACALALRASQGSVCRGKSALSGNGACEACGQGFLQHLLRALDFWRSVDNDLCSRLHVPERAPPQWRGGVGSRRREHAESWSAQVSPVLPGEVLHCPSDGRSTSIPSFHCLDPAVPVKGSCSESCIGRYPLQWRVPAISRIARC